MKKSKNLIKLIIYIISNNNIKIFLIKIRDI